MLGRTGRAARQARWPTLDTKRGRRGGRAHWQGCEAGTLASPAPAHCHASPSSPGASAHSSGRSCHPPPQLLSQPPQGPTWALASHSAGAATRVSVISANHPCRVSSCQSPAGRQ